MFMLFISNQKQYDKLNVFGVSSFAESVFSIKQSSNVHIQCVNYKTVRSWCCIGVRLSWHYKATTSQWSDFKQTENTQKRLNSTVIDTNCKYRQRNHSTTRHNHSVRRTNTTVFVILQQVNFWSIENCDKETTSHFFSHFSTHAIEMSSIPKQSVQINNSVRYKNKIFVLKMKW